MTNGWMDIQNADLVLVMGGNPAEAHPCGFKWAIKAREKNGAKIVVVDPRLNRTAAVADKHVAIRCGSDLVFMGAVINYVLQNKKYQEGYVKAFTNAPFIVKDTYSFDAATGLFSGYDPKARKYDQSLWGYDLDENGMVKQDPTLSHPRCSFQLTKKHYERYTPELVEKVCGVKKEEFLEVAEMIGETGAPDKAMTHLYALGWTEHSFGTQLIGSMAVLQLLLGNIGLPGGQIGALRGHGNVQGTTDLGAFTNSLPGYLKAPKAEHTTLQQYLDAFTPKANRENSMNYYGNTPKFFVSLLKAWWGSAATKENDFAYDYLPKYETPKAYNAILDDMYNGKMDGLFVMGANILTSSPNANKSAIGMSKLKWMVNIDLFPIDTAYFWKTSKDLDPSKIETECFLLPGLGFAEKDGTFSNSGRTIKWRYKGPDPQGDCRDEKWIFSQLYWRLKALYEKEGGPFPDPILNLTWNYKNPESPSADEILQEMNGFAVENLVDDKGNVVVKKGDRLSTFGQLKDDGTTSCGMWIYGGVYPPSGNRSASVGTEDPSGFGVFPNYAFSWPANRRILYNRASADPSGKPWSNRKKYLWWDEGTKRWVGHDVPDIGPTLPPATGPFIMNAEGVARLFAPALVEGPFPEYYEPYESPIANALHPENPTNPVVRVYKSEHDVLGTPDKFPYVALTYRVTEHYHFYTKFMKGPSRAFPHMFIEMPVELAKEKGIANGDRVRVTSARGSLEALAMVTRRIKPLICDGKPVYHVGIPIHWGFQGLAKGGLVNLLTPFVWDPNALTPEFKGFLVNVEKATGGAA